MATPDAIELVDLSKTSGESKHASSSEDIKHTSLETRDSSYLVGRSRANTLENIPLQDVQGLRGRQALGGRYLRHRGSVRGTFTTETRLTRQVQKVINSIGRGRRDYSLFVFHRNSRFRKSVKSVAKSRVFKFLMGLLVLLHSVALCFYLPAVNEDDSYPNTVIYYVTVVVILLYILEAGVNIIAYGLVTTPKAYLKDAAHVLDVAVITVGILYIATSNGNHVIGEVFASFMALKLIKLIVLSESVRFILKALAMSVAPLFYLSILTFIVITFLALVGMQLYTGTLHGGCFANYSTPAGQVERVLVSAFPCDRSDSNLTVGSHVCPHGTSCLEWNEGPNRGIISFDNMGVAYLTVFQVISLEGWIRILYLYESALGYTWAWAYFVVVMFFGSIIILNLWTGVLTSVFIGVSDREEEHGKSRKLKEKQKISNDLKKYNDWLRIAAEMDAPSETGSIIDRRHSLFMWTDPMDEDLDDKGESEEESGGGSDDERGDRRGARARKLWHLSRKWLRKLVKHKFFLFSVLVLRAVNLILLMSLHFPSSEEFNTVIYALNYVFSVLYVTEFLMRILSLSSKKYRSLTYWKNSLHLVEIVFSLLTVLELLVFVPVQVLREVHIGVIINAVWCLKLIMFVKYTRSWEDMRKIIRTVFQLLPSVLSLLALVLIFLFVFTILGIRLFGERLSNTGHVEPNFDDLYQSFLLVFQLMTTEDWNNVLFTSLDHWIDADGVVVGGLFAIYFVIGVILGSFILLSVFLAMSVDKLSEVRSLETASVQESEKSEKRRKEKKQHINELKKEPQVKRRTIRRAMKFLSDNPAERTQLLKDPKKKWGTQFSLPSERIHRHQAATEDTETRERPYVRSTSSPTSPLSPVEGSPVQSQVREEAPKLRNPLRLMKQKSEFFEKQRFRLSQLSSEPPSAATADATAASASDHPTQPTRMSSLEKIKKMNTKLSFDSAVSNLSEVTTESVIPFIRTQSSPADSPLNTVPDVTTFSEMPMLDTIEEVKCSTDNENDLTTSQETIPQGQRSLLERQTCLESTPERPSIARSLSADQEDDLLTSALRRGGSLEDIVSTEMKESRGASRTATKLKTKAQLVFEWVKDYVGNIQLDPQKELAEIPNHSSFFILAPDNRFRVLCYKLVCSKSFSTITFVAVLLSSLLLTLEVPIGVDRSEQTLCSLQLVIIYLDSFFVAYFLVEMALKMIALGVVFHKGSYLRGFFNILDFIIVITNVVPIIVFLTRLPESDPSICIAYSYQINLVVVNILRVLRVLRPLRAIRIAGVYLVVTGLVTSIKSMFSIFFMIMLVLIVFAVAGVHFFKGQFWYCTDPVKTLELECSGHYYVYDYTFGGPSQVPGLSCPQVESREWRQRGLNFDNIGTAILSLFSMLTIEGWQNVMYASINSASPVDSMTPRGQTPGEKSPQSAIFFILYMVVMALILVQLFTGFVIVTFQEVGVKAFRDTKLNRNEMNCLYFALTTRPRRVYIPRHKLHRTFHEKMLPIVNHVFTKAIIVAALIVNSIFLALVIYGNDELRKASYYINIFFTSFFTVEAVMKIIVLTPPNYFRSIGNVFDFAIVIGSILELFIQLAFPTEIDQRFKYSHIASSFRVLRLLGFIPSVKLILWTVIKSLQIFPYVGYLLMIVFFMYTVVGMQVFGDIRRASIDELSNTEITEYNNFANFPQALLLMIRMATGENWQDIMLSCVAGQQCDQGGEPTCGDDFAYFFFPSFFFLSSIMILNLFVAIVIDNFDYIVRDKSILGAHQLHVFVKLWSHYDPQAMGMLPPKTVIELMRQCNPPVGWGQLCPESQAYKKMIKMNMPVKDGMVSFNATLFALVRTSLGIHCKGCPECAMKCNVEFKNKLKILFPRMAVKKIDEVLPLENDPTVGEEYAALLVQRVWRAYTFKRRKVIELFQGTKRVLKAGLRALPDTGPDLLRRNTSDFEFDLPAMPPRRSSEATSISTEAAKSPSVLDTHMFTMEPVTHDRPHPSPPLSPSIPVEVDIHREHEDVSQPRPGMEDNVSELSFTSAYSSPVQDSDTTSGRLETTV